MLCSFKHEQFCFLLTSSKFDFMRNITVFLLISLTININPMGPDKDS